MSSRPVRRLRTAGLILAALVGGIVFVTPTSAAPPKYFDVTTHTDSIPAGATTDVVLTITNKTQNKIEFDGVQIAIPDGLVIAGDVTAVTFDGKNPAAVIDYDVDPPTITFLDSDVGKDEYIDVTIPVEAPCANPTYSWFIDVRQSNNFFGTDNKFDPVYLDALKTTEVTGSCQLRFGNQPAKARPGQVITAVDFEPTATAKVTVEVTDGAGRVADVDLTVNLEARFANGSDAFGFSGLQATMTDGVASFDGLRSELTTPSAIYKLVASASGYGDATSALFALGSGAAITQCTSEDGEQSDDFTTNGAVGCSTGVIDGSDGETAKIDVFDNDDLAGELTAAFSTATSPDCPTYTEVTDQLFFNVNITGGTPTASMYKQITLTKKTTVDNVLQQQVCFEAPYSFPAIVLNPALTTPLGVPVPLVDQLWAAVSTGVFEPQQVGNNYFGLLLPCALVADPSYRVTIPGLSPDGTASPPCIVSRSFDAAKGEVTIVVNTPVTDPAARW